jgi:hypothetical protein
MFLASFDQLRVITGVRITSQGNWMFKNPKKFSAKFEPSAAGYSLYASGTTSSGGNSGAVLRGSLSQRVIWLQVGTWLSLLDAHGLVIHGNLRKRLW